MQSLQEFPFVDSILSRLVSAIDLEPDKNTDDDDQYFNDNDEPILLSNRLAQSAQNHGFLHRVTLKA